MRTTPWCRASFMIMSRISRGSERYEFLRDEDILTASFWAWIAGDDDGEVPNSGQHKSAFIPYLHKDCLIPVS